MPFPVQFWMFSVPVAYPMSLVPARWQWLYGLNPIVGGIGWFRWALTGKGQTPSLLLITSAGAVIVVLVGNMVLFRKREATIADVV
jgi:lipopolysaccharide transport system permease protein